MSKGPKEDQDTIAFYCTLMDEIKFRLGFVEDIIYGRNLIAGTIGKDICFLQLRMICELIALSCLVAHGDIKETKARKFAKKWEADFLISALKKIHADFYPQPIIPHPLDAGVPTKIGEIRRPPIDVKSGFLTVSDLPKLYHLCGRELHRGNLNDLLANRGKKVRVEYLPIRGWVHKIIKLLNFHRIILVDRTEYWVEMKNPKTGTAYASRLTERRSARP
ncbi:hypothetical protein [Bradyrhizobium elkanii]|uniref:hypothetical protein n=1 Tax=Bradyrhizobium elkanii TaxID=29448 RepID=UPI000570A5E8|nr:hypothetical protein [Bradyrhizobium elkanii]